MEYQDGDDVIINMNSAKDIVLSTLMNDGVITEDQAMEYSEKWVIMIVKPSLFERWRNAFRKGDASSVIKYVKIER